MNIRVVGIASIGAVVILPLVIILWGVPQYRVYKQEMRGAAALAEARQERQILVEQARAEVEAAEQRAEAIRIVGEAAQQFPEYRNQEFIGAFAEALKRGDIEKIIYVPTEANIPIIEARN
ncbi:MULTISPECIES: hypothetical protein [unclassified Halomonas]|uniref:hypothetical protein n=1 Tax=unclassified Halomonas TaxID=2609666 RepID=UPI0020769619|nr:MULTISPECIES: hypothetical protein [unclassified Halomonas]